MSAYRVLVGVTKLIWLAALGLGVVRAQQEWLGTTSPLDVAVVALMAMATAVWWSEAIMRRS